MNIWQDYEKEAALAGLKKSATRLVLGSGPVPAKIALVGEAPGAEEDRLGKPFVGKSGERLNEALEDALLLRSEIYVTNIVKLRPESNRTPTPREIRASMPYLEFELEQVKPAVVGCLGKAPFSAFFPGKKPLYAPHGYSWKGVTVMALYHPAYTLYNQSKKGDFFSQIRALRDMADEG